MESQRSSDRGPLSSFQTPMEAYVRGNPFLKKLEWALQTKKQGDPYLRALQQVIWTLTMISFHCNLQETLNLHCNDLETLNMN